MIYKANVIKKIQFAQINYNKFFLNLCKLLIIRKIILLRILSNGEYFLHFIKNQIFQFLKFEPMKLDAIN